MRNPITTCNYQKICKYYSNNNYCAREFDRCGHFKYFARLELKIQEQRAEEMRELENFDIGLYLRIKGNK